MKKKNPADSKKNQGKSKPVKAVSRESRQTLSTKAAPEPNPQAGKGVASPALKTENIIKAAKMILAVGEENAVEILKHLDSDSVEKVVSEMIKLKSLKDDEKITILRDFKKNLDGLGSADYGGISQAEKFLEKALGREKAEKHINKVKNSIHVYNYTEIESYPPENAALVLGSELAQTTAFILATISSSFAAKIFTNLDAEYRVSVSRKMAQMNRVSPEIVRLAYETILNKLKRMDRSDLNVIEGENRLIEILNHMDRSLEDKILNNLEIDDPEMSSRIRDKLRVFEDIMQLTTKELRKVFDLVPNQAVWAKALKGAGQNIVKHIFSSISMNRASDIMTEMNYIEKLPLKEIELNRRTIMDAIDKLEKEGLLMLRKNKEEMVE
jgi:flagellar motor switch protein FliG